MLRDWLLKRLLNGVNDDELDNYLLQINRRIVKRDAEITNSRVTDSSDQLPWAAFVDPPGENPVLPLARLEFSKGDDTTEFAQAHSTINDTLRTSPRHTKLPKIDQAFEQYCMDMVGKAINLVVQQDETKIESLRVGGGGRRSERGADSIILCSDPNSPTYGVILIQSKWSEYGRPADRSWDYTKAGGSKLKRLAEWFYTEGYIDTELNPDIIKFIEKYQTLLSNFRKEASMYNEDTEEEHTLRPRIPHIYIVSCCAGFSESKTNLNEWDEISARTLDFTDLVWLEELNIDEISIPAPAKKPVILKANLIQDEETYGESGKIQTWIGYVTAYDLCAYLYRVTGSQDYVRERGLLYSNVREELATNSEGKSRPKVIRRNIQETATNNPAMFFSKNNGVTLVCKKLEPITSSSGKGNFFMHEPQLVNGGQTTNALWELYAGQLSDNSLHNTKVAIKIAVAQDPVTLRDIRLQIAKASNDQNATNDRDIRSGETLTKYIKGEFKKIQVYYETKRGGWSSLTDAQKETFAIPADAGKKNHARIGNEESAKRLWAFFGGGQIASNQKSKLWSMTDSFEQNPLFTNDDRYKEIDGKFLQVGAQTARLPVSDYCLDVLLSNYLFGELGATGSSKQTGHTRNFRQLIKSAKTSFDQYAQSGPDRSYGFVLYKLLEFENYIIGLFNQVLEVYFGDFNDSSEDIRRSFSQWILGDYNEGGASTKARKLALFSPTKNDLSDSENAAQTGAQMNPIHSQHKLQEVLEERGAFILSVMELIIDALILRDDRSDVLEAKDYTNRDIGPVLQALDQERLKFLQFSDKKSQTFEGWEAARDGALVLIEALTSSGGGS